MAEQKKNYPGMFDLIKGYMMILIIMEHTHVVVPREAMLGDNPSLLVKILFLIQFIFSFDYAPMPLFFIISGYGFSCTSMKKCVKKQTKTLLKPYFLTGCCVTIFYFFSRYAVTHTLQDAVIKTSGIALSFLFGVSRGTVVNGFRLFCIGSVWFLLALYLSWLFLNAITLYIPERKRPYIVFASVCLGYLLGRDVMVPFCLTQSMIGVGYMYIGQCLKQKDWLYKKLPPIVWCALVLSAAVSTLFGKVDMLYPLWKLGLVDIVGAGCYAFLLARGTVFLNRYNNIVTDKLRSIGRYSLWIMCVHTVESSGPMWGVFANQFSNPYVAFVTIFVLRCCLVYVLCKLVGLCSQKLRARKRRMRQRSQIGSI